MPSASLLRAHIESMLAERLPGSLQCKPAITPEIVSTGIVELDELMGGGVPRGCFSEIYGTVSSGRTTLLVSLLAQVTHRGEVAALIDVTDAFAPDLAAAAGVDVASLLWVRCGGNRKETGAKWGMEARIEQALKITDWLLQAGGFSVIVLDLAGVPPRLARRIPLTSWFRFRRAVENTATAFLLLEEQPYAQTCASLVMKMKRAEVSWSGMQQETPQPGATILLNEISFSGEVVRSRIRSAGEMRRPVTSTFTVQPGWSVCNAS